MSMIAQYMPRYAQFIPKMCHRCFSNIPKICPKRQRWAESPLEWSSANFVNRGWMAARRQRIGGKSGDCGYCHTLEHRDAVEHRREDNHLTEDKNINHLKFTLLERY